MHVCVFAECLNGILFEGEFFQIAQEHVRTDLVVAGSDLTMGGVVCGNPIAALRRGRGGGGRPTPRFYLVFVFVFVLVFFFFYILFCVDLLC